MSFFPLVACAIFFASLFSPSAAQASGTGSAHVRELYRGARATGMGGAFTGLADDEQAIFYNPAGLAGITRPTFHAGSVLLEGSADFISSPGALSELSGFGPASVNAFMGKNVYGRGQVTPSLVFPNFGISLVIDGQAAFFARNKSLPWLTLGYQNTNGVQAAAGFSVFGKRRRANNDLRIGAAAKMLWRRGGYKRLSMQEVFNASKNTIGDVTGPFGKGYGADLGTQYVHEMNKLWRWGMGLAWTDIGNTAFSAAEAEPIPANLSYGLYVTYQPNPFLEGTFVYDLRHILKTMDMRKKNHVGLEIGMPMFKLYGGLNQLSLTYGASADFSLLKVTAVSYAEDLAEEAGQDTDRRYLLSFDLKFGL